MKKVLCIIITITLLLTSTSLVYAKADKTHEKKDHKTTNQQIKDDKKQKYVENEDNKQEIKNDNGPVIKYGNYVIPMEPISNGMGATVTFDKTTAVLKIVKKTITILIDFKNETVVVNGVADHNTGIFSVKNSKKAIVLLKSIKNLLEEKLDTDKDESKVEDPELKLPTKVTVTTVGSITVPNTLNSTTLYMTATANIIAGQATGGKAELYVGSKLVATDPFITATDTIVTFTTSDNTPTNTELQAMVPKGGAVTVKLYNANNKVVTSAVANPTLLVDYISPSITGITSAVYNAVDNKLLLTFTGVAAVGDIVDVTKISLYDSTLGRTYQLTNTPETGSSGVVGSSNSLVISIGSNDKIVVSGFGNSIIYLTIAVGSLMKDAAGNTSPSFTAVLTIQASLGTGLNSPTNIVITPIGAIVKTNTLNSTTLYMTAIANITAGQATGGKAELYVGSRLVATDSYIAATDSSVTFTTADNSPTNAKLQSIIPVGGVVTVKFYNSTYSYVTSTVANPTLIVDYVAPTVTTIITAIYSVTDNHLYLFGTGIAGTGDIVDVTKITLNASFLGKAYQLTNISGVGSCGVGSCGVVDNTNSLVIDIGSYDRLGLSGFGNTTLYLTISVGSLLTDAAGNTSNSFSAVQTIPVTIMNR